MPTAWIVEAVDVFENGNFDLSAGLPVSAPNHFCLERFEKALNCGVVIAVTLSAHGCCQTMLSQDLLIVMGTVLAAAIRVMNAALRWPTQGNRHVQGTDRQVLLHPVADGPTVTRKSFACKTRRAITRRECRSRMMAR